MKTLQWRKRARFSGWKPINVPHLHRYAGYWYAIRSDGKRCQWIVYSDAKSLKTIDADKQSVVNKREGRRALDRLLVINGA